MADNFTANAGAGGDTFGADDIGGVKFPRSKLIIGADGSNDGDVSSANPLPVTGTVAVTNAGLTELAGAINASAQMDVNIAASNATVAVSNAGLTELAAAINSNQLDVNIVTDSVGIGGGTQYTEDAAAAANPVGNAMIVVRDDARGGSLTTTDGDNVALRGNNNGELYVKHTDSIAVTNAGLTELAAAINGSSQMDVNLAASNATVTVASHHVTNAGTFAVQVDGSALTALQLIDDPVFADDAAYTVGTSKVMVAGGVVDDASTDAADEGDAAAIRVTTTRQVVVNPQPHTTGGLVTARSLDLDETEEEIKGTAGQVYGWNITNFATATRYVKFYNATAANVTVGTTTPLFTLAIPGNASDDTMLAQAIGGMGIAFDTAITWAATTGLADNDTGAPGANDVAGTVWYK